MALSDAKKVEFGDKYDPKTFFLEGYDYIMWAVDLSNIPTLEGDQE